MDFPEGEREEMWGRMGKGNEGPSNTLLLADDGDGDGRDGGGSKHHKKFGGESLMYALFFL